VELRLSPLYLNPYFNSMKNNEIHRQPSAFVSVLASLLVPASGHSNDLKKYWHPRSFEKAEGSTVADDDHTLRSSSYISQSASIVIEDGERSQSLRKAYVHFSCIRQVSLRLFFLFFLRLRVGCCCSLRVPSSRYARCGRCA
jgi:hypothetical protein